MDARPLEERAPSGDAMTAPSLLLVRFAAIGDCVMAAWTATAYRKRFPSGNLIWAIDTRCRPVVDDDALVSGIVEFPRDRWKANRWSPATWREQLRTYAGLRKHHFEWGVDLQGHSKTALALRIASPRRRIAVGATDILARRLNPQLSASPDGTHTVQRNHAALCSFGDFELPLRPFMPESTRLQRDPNLISISVGAGSKAKMWQPDRWSEVASEMVARGYDVALLGGPDDPRVVVPGARDCIATIPLRETMRWVARSALHLAADTGTGHMAAAYGVPVVSVFGPTDPRICRPYADDARVLRNGAETASVTVADVLTAIDGVLAATLKGAKCVS
ncbi:MAG: glycosyltransferase family 9 protein [Fimbriimonadaceae bacterium]